MAIRLRPTSAFVAASAPGSAASARRARRAARCTASASSLRPTLRGQVGQLEVRLRQRPPRGDVGLLAEQGSELAVEVGRRLQQPVAQLLELVLLEQEVLADAGVEGLDRLDGQVVAGLHRGLGAARRQLRAFVGRRAAALARVCTASTADSPTTPASQRRRRRR